MEILTLLNPSTINPDSTGGLPELTAADLSACLAGCDNVGLMIIFRRVMGDQSKHKKAYERLQKAVFRFADQNKWKISKNDQKLTNLTNLCLLEYTNPLKCPTCNGTGMYRYKECNTCKGSTNYVLTDSQRAEIIGIHRSNWKRNWKLRHKELTDFFSEILPDYEYRVKKKFYKRLINRD